MQRAGLDLIQVFGRWLAHAGDDVGLRVASVRIGDDCGAGFFVFRVAVVRLCAGTGLNEDFQAECTELRDSRWCDGGACLCGVGFKGSEKAFCSGQV